MPGIKSRRLRHRVEVQQQSSIQNPDDGSIVVGWVKYDDRWAEYVASSVREFIAASATQSEVKGRFVLRADPAITPGMRILHGNPSKVYAVLGVMPDPDSGLEYITAAVSEGVIFDGR